MHNMKYLTLLTGMIIGYPNTSFASNLMPKPSSIIESPTPISKGHIRTIFDLPIIPEETVPLNVSGTITAGSGLGMAASVSTIVPITNVKSSDPLKGLMIEIPETPSPEAPELSTRNVSLAISPAWNARSAQ